MDSNIKMVNKISEVINLFLNRSIKAQIWNIDTNFFNTIERLKNSLLKEKNKFNTNCLYSIILKPVKYDNKKCYLTYIKDNLNNQIQVFPYKTTSNKKQCWSMSGTRQFIQELQALEIISTNENITKIGTRNNWSEIEFVFNFLNIKNILAENSENALFEITFQTLIKSYDHFRKDIRNLGFSMFLCALQKYLNLDENITIKKYLFQHFPNNIIIEKVKKKDNTKGFYLFSKEYETYITKINKETYKTFSKYFGKKTIFEKVVDALINSNQNFEYKNNLILKDLTDEVSEALKELVKSKIQDRRSQVRTSLLSRISNNLSNDLNGLIIENYHIKDCEAAHIYNVKQSKKEIFILIEKNNISNENQFDNCQEIKNELDKISNINNVIFMPSHLHKLFDDNVITFDKKGNLKLTESFKWSLKNDGSLEKRIELLKQFCKDNKIENVKINTSNFDKTSLENFISQRV